MNHWQAITVLTKSRNVTWLFSPPFVAVISSPLAGGNSILFWKGRFDTKDTVQISEKVNLTLEEAAAYFNIGIGKLRELSNSENCPFVLWVGSKRLIKRKRMEAFLDGAFSI